MLNLNDNRIACIVDILYKKGFFKRVSLNYFASDFREKMILAVNLIRKCFLTDKLDFIAYDIVSAYCLSDDYCLLEGGNLEDTDDVFNSFFEKYIQPFVQLANYVEYDSRNVRK